MNFWTMVFFCDIQLLQRAGSVYLLLWWVSADIWARGFLVLFWLKLSSIIYIKIEVISSWLKIAGDIPDAGLFHNFLLEALVLLLIKA